MADTIRMQIDNARAVQNALDKFEKKVAKKIVRRGLRAAWKPLLDRARENARALGDGGPMSSLIAKKLQLRAFKKQKRGQYGMYVRLRPGVDEFISISKTGQRSYIPAAIEYGHAFPGRGGKGAGKDVAARPYMRPAADWAVPRAPGIFKTHLVKAIRAENMKR